VSVLAPVVAVVPPLASPEVPAAAVAVPLLTAPLASVDPPVVEPEPLPPTLPVVSPLPQAPPPSCCMAA
jgi:hypothetical protein